MISKIIRYFFVILITILPVHASGSDTTEIPAVKVLTSVIKEDIIAEQIPFEGLLSFNLKSNISADVDGLITSVKINEGDRLKKNEIFLTLNTDFIKNEIATISAQINQVKLRIEQAEKELQRFKTLFEEKAVREKDYDDASFDLMHLHREKDVLESRLALAKLKEKKSELRAPFEAIVLSKLTEVGVWVSPGTPLCVLGSAEELVADIPIDEHLLRFSNIGDEVEVIISAFEKTVTGRIVNIIPVANERTKAVTVRISIPPLEIPVENFSVTAFIPIHKAEKYSLVPRDAIIEQAGNRFFYSIKDEIAVAVPIKVISFYKEYGLIQNPDVTAGMLAIVDGNERLRPGQPVNIIGQR